MKSIKYFLDFFLFSNIFISLCAAALTAETYFLVRSEIHWEYISFVFFSTLVIYDFPSFFFNPPTDLLPTLIRPSVLQRRGRERIDSERHLWVVENRNTRIILSAISLIAIAVTVFFFPFRFVVCIIPSTALAFAYFFPQTHLRSITGLKAVLVAFVWMAVTAFYPLLLISFPDSDWEKVFSTAAIFLFVERFFFLLPLCIIFNVRDMEADRNTNVKTIPIVYGVRTTIIISLLSVFVFSSLVIFNGGFSSESIALMTSAIVSGILILKSSADKGDYFYSLWIDGMILLQAGLVLEIGGLQNLF